MLFFIAWKGYILGVHIKIYNNEIRRNLNMPLWDNAMKYPCTQLNCPAGLCDCVCLSTYVRMRRKVDSFVFFPIDLVVRVKTSWLSYCKSQQLGGSEVLSDLSLLLNSWILQWNSHDVRTHTTRLLNGTQNFASIFLHTRVVAHADNHTGDSNRALRYLTTLSENCILNFQPVWLLRRFVIFHLNMRYIYIYFVCCVIKNAYKILRIKITFFFEFRHPRIFIYSCYQRNSSSISFSVHVTQINSLYSQRR